MTAVLNDKWKEDDLDSWAEGESPSQPRGFAQKAIARKKAASASRKKTARAPSAPLPRKWNSDPEAPAERMPASALAAPDQGWPAMKIVPFVPTEWRTEPEQRAAGSSAAATEPVKEEDPEDAEKEEEPKVESKKVISDQQKEDAGKGVQQSEAAVSASDMKSEATLEPSSELLTQSEAVEEFALYSISEMPSGQRSPASDASYPPSAVTDSLPKPGAPASSRRSPTRQLQRNTSTDEAPAAKLLKGTAPEG